MYKRIVDPETRLILTGAFMGLITYFVHGVLNNYLDQDKAAVPVYAMLAVVVAIDVFHGKKDPDNKSLNKT